MSKSTHETNRVQPSSTKMATQICEGSSITRVSARMNWIQPNGSRCSYCIPSTARSYEKRNHQNAKCKWWKDWHAKTSQKHTRCKSTSPPKTGGVRREVYRIPQFSIYQRTFHSRIMNLVVLAERLRCIPAIPRYTPTSSEKTQ